MKAKDLAKKLGVSPATISLVLNNKPGVSDSLRHSLLEKIRELGCENMLSGSGSPQGMGDNDQTHPVIAYLIYTSSDEHNDRFAFYPAVLEGAEMEARDNNYNLVVLHMNSEGNPNLPNLLRCSGNVIGAIIQAFRINENIIEDIRNLEIPCVFVDSYRPERKVSSVCVNNEQGIMGAVQHLKERGHRRIGYVYSGCDSDCQLERRRCFHQALRTLDLEDVHENYFVAGCGADANDIDCLSQAFSKSVHMPTALIAENDRQAWRTIKALRRSGYRVPEDVSVIGFDDRSICSMVEPNLTSVKNYRHLMGRECIIMLQNLRRLKRLGFKRPCLKYELPTELICRNSVADCVDELGENDRLA